MTTELTNHLKYLFTQDLYDRILEMNRRFMTSHSTKSTFLKKDFKNIPVYDIVKRRETPRNEATLKDLHSLRSFDGSTVFPLTMADACLETDAICISSSRLKGVPTRTILYPRVNRLTPAYYRNCLRHDGPWKDKRGGILWRGVDSGNIVDESIPLKGRSNRWSFCRCWDGHVGSDGVTWDLGITRFAQTEAFYDLKTLGLEDKAKGKLPVHRLIRQKYTLCLEGNDVSSQFFWALAGQTLPLHPYPFFFETNWFHGPVYDEPIPWIHFVPLKHDGSDLGERYEWCLANQDRVLAMVKAGQAHVSRYLDDSFFDSVRQAFANHLEILR